MTDPRKDLDRVLLGSDSARVQRLVVENLYVLCLSKNLQTLDTCRVGQVGGSFARVGSGGQEGRNCVVVAVVAVVVCSAADGADGECPSGIGGLDGTGHSSDGANGGAEHGAFYVVEDEVWDADVAEEVDLDVTVISRRRVTSCPLLPERGFGPFPDRRARIGGSGR